MIEVFFLGTGCASPTITRFHPSVAVRIDGELFLFDCGEGTQIRLRQNKLSFFKIKHVFITHLHGDHIFGLPGLLYSMSMDKRTEPVFIYGPKGIRETINKVISLGSTPLNFEVNVREIGSERVIENNVIVDSIEVDHSVSCVAYSLKEKDVLRIDKNIMKKKGLKSGLWAKEVIEKGETVVEGKLIKREEITLLKKGRKIVYVGDTRFYEPLIDFSRNATLLIHEATYNDELKNKATEYQHSTAKDAATIAKKAEVNKLVITHYSKRFKSTDSILEEAKSIFPETIAAKDNMKIFI